MTESVWDYPRPPAVRVVDERVEIVVGGVVVAQTPTAVQVLETSHPPTYYVPREAFVDGALVPVSGSTYCEFKGQAEYFDVVSGETRAERAAWHYPHPAQGYDALLGQVAVMPQRVDECRVDGERVTPQEGDFYGGWITTKVTGPFKGAPGTLGW